MILRRLLPASDRTGDGGSAIVEFVLFAVVAIVPLAWAALALQQLVAVHQATQVAAGESLRAFLSAPSEAAGHERAQVAAQLALSGFPGVQRFAVHLECGADPCLQPGASVRSNVSVAAELPQIPILGVVPSLSARAEQYGVVDAFAAAR